MRQLVLIAALFLTPQAHAGPFDVLLCGPYKGVSAAAIGADTYRVSAALNRCFDAGAVQDRVMLKAAEIARDNGAIGFEILTAADTTRTDYAATGNYAGGIDVGAVTRPGGYILVHLVRDPARPHIDAADTIAAIGPRLSGH